MFVLELAELELPGQDKQTDDIFAPIDVEYVLAGHPSHDVLPLSFVYLPAAHRTHDPPFGPLVPALHLHEVIEELEDSEIEFTGQEEQTVAPATTENVFAGHSRHSFCMVPYLIYLPTSHCTQTPCKM
jgi:hypothetical protein